MDACMSTPLSTDEAVRILSADRDPDFAQGIIDLVQAGHVIVSRDEKGGLRFKLTSAGEQAAKQLIEDLAEGS